jgi:hypothetical protein
MHALKKGLITSQLLDKENKITDLQNTYNSNKEMGVLVSNNKLLPQSIQNDDMNSNMNSNLLNYLNKMHYKDQNLSKFSNAMYQKFKKVFLIQTQIKSSNFKPTPEINGRVKLLK